MGDTASNFMLYQSAPFFPPLLLCSATCLSTVVSIWSWICIRLSNGSALLSPRLDGLARSSASRPTQQLRSLFFFSFSLVHLLCVPPLNEGKDCLPHSRYVAYFSRLPCAAFLS